MRKAFNVKDHIGHFNAVRRDFGVSPFEVNDLKLKLKEVHCVQDNTFICGMVKAGILRRVTKDVFVFTSDKPVHFSKLQTAYNYCIELRHGKAKNSTLSQILSDSAALSAISLLKGLGCNITLQDDKKIEL